MQEAALDFFRSYDKPDDPDDVKDDEIPLDERDFGWALGWATAQEIGVMFERYRILPDAGGWWDQRADVRRDLMQFIQYVNYFRRTGSTEESVPLSGDDDSKDWLELM